MLLEKLSRSTIALLAGLVLLGGSAAQADDAEADISVCGHLEELEAGRDALASGDREQALRHLRAAREILVECERSARTAEPNEPTPRIGRDWI
ncbi:MAG: hypothetical protein R3F35_08980 [Myxococcota bacterium]